MVMFAFLAACLTLSARAGRVGIDPDKLVPFYLLITAAGLLGSRLLHFVMAEPERFFANPLIFFDVGAGGFAFYGGAIAAGLVGAWYGRWAGMDMWKLIDAGAPCIMLGLAVGRMGCFMAGCCHGSACPVPQSSTILSMPGGAIVSTEGAPFVALNFVEGMGVGGIHGVPVYPTQLWESAAGLALFFFLSWMWRSARKFDGQIMAVLLLLYPVLRSTIEGFRGDTVRGTDWFGLLSTSQVVSIPVVLSGLILLVWRSRHGLAPETPIVYDDDEL